MFAFVGLGNPGDKYVQTRHNMGFVFIDYFSQRVFGKAIPKARKLNSQLIGNQSMVLAKPLTYMNNSGKAVKAMTDFYKFPLANLYIIHDDLDIRLGEFKIQYGRGPKVHYGINSVEQELGTDLFWRVRIGVDNRDPENRIIGEAYVLKRFEVEEQEMVTSVIKTCADKLLQIING